MMRPMNLALTLACLVVVVAGNGLPRGVDYSQYDPDRLKERYDIIQALVRPRASYRPKIGSAYSQKGNRNKINYGYQPVSYAKRPVYTPVKNTGYVYAPAKNTGYVNYAPAKNTGYVNYAPTKNPSYNVGYANAAPRAPVNYGFQSYGGIRFGGGKVHPVFNNDLLYKNKGLGPYDTTDPIFIGGGPTKAAPSVTLKNAPFRAQTSYNTFNKVSSPLIDAYGNRAPVSNYNYPYYG